MKHPVRYAALTMLALGGVGLVLRRLLYSMALDVKNLLPLGHPLETLLWVLTAAAAAAVVVFCLRMDKNLTLRSGGGLEQAVGHLMMGLGMVLTLIWNLPKMEGGLGFAWEVLGKLAPVMLAAAGIASCRGKQPHFLLHLPTCLFLMIHMVNQYRTWSAEPQPQAYVFALLGCVGLTLFAYYCTAFDVAMGNSRMYVGAGLASLYLCTVNLARTEYPLLYLGGIAWVATDLWSAAFLPEPREPERTAQDDPA